MKRSASSTMALICALALALTCFAVREADAQFGSVLNPKTYTSPNGRYSLFVDPSHPSGGGEATYRFKEGEAERWSATLPFTLWRAAVSDGGTVGGYAYTHGLDGWLPQQADRGPGDLVVAIIGRDGKIRLRQAMKREENLALTNPPQPPEPTATDLFVDEMNDRLVVRVRDPNLNRRRESWWTYRLSTGAEIAKLQPSRPTRISENDWSIADAKPVSGTPLTLVHWRQSEFVPDSPSGGMIWTDQFTLNDLKAERVWMSRTIPAHKAVTIEELYREGNPPQCAILRTDQSNRFDIFFPAELKRVTFSVAKNDTGKWQVKEIAKAPHSIEPPLQQKPVPIPVVALKPLEPVTLQINGGPSVNPFRNVFEFVFYGEGRVAFIRREESQPGVFVCADQKGKLLLRVPLAIETTPGSQWSLCWVGGSRFVVANSETGKEAAARAWWIDASSGGLQATPNLDCPSIVGLVGFSDGAFVALARMHSQDTIETTVVGFDIQGRRSWTLKEDQDEQNPAALSRVQGIARTSKDEIAVLENFRDRVKLFDRQGRFLRTIDLEKSWKRKPRFLAAIAEDLGGGLLIRDSGASPPFVRTTGDGTILAGIIPRFADERAVSVAGCVRVAPDGRLWACDDHSIVRLTDQGIVDLVLGPTPDGKQVGETAGMIVDRTGKIYAVDKRTGAIHEFDVSGGLHHVREIKTTDFREVLRDPAIAIGDHGPFFLASGGSATQFDASHPFADFFAKRTRLRNVASQFPVCYAQPTTGNVVAIGSDEVTLFDPAGTVLRKIRRRGDNKWFNFTENIALAADGSLAVLDSRTLKSERPWNTVNLYGPNGDPLHMISLPDDVGYLPWITRSDNRIVVTGETGLLFYDRSGAPIQRSELPANFKKEWAKPFAFNNGRELAIFDGTNHVLYRFEMP